MSKRASSGPSTPRGKRSKVSHDQKRIDQFFASPKKFDAGTSSLAESPKLEASPASSKETKRQDIIDVDALDEDLLLKVPSSSKTPALSELPKMNNTQSSSLPISINVGSSSTVAVPAFTSLSTDPVFYDPMSQQWPHKAVPYAFLVHALATLSQTRSRIIILNTLTNTLRTIIERHSPSLLSSIYLLSNTLAPPYMPIELGIGHSIISRAIQHISGLTPSALKKLYNNSGDAGDVAFAAKSNLRTLLPHPPLLVPSLYESLLKIARCKGQGAAKEKEKIVEKLLVSANGEEVRFLVRTLSQNLRVGAVKTSILTALARAMVLARISLNTGGHSVFRPSEELLSKVQPLPVEAKKKIADVARKDLYELFSKAEALMRQVYVRHPSYEDIISALLEVGLEGLSERVPLMIGVPLHPTLGSPMRSMTEAYDNLSGLPFSAEFKYDGQRAQIHARVDETGNVVVDIFSRHLECMTSKYPDIIALVRSILKDDGSQVTSFILDSEIVAIDVTTGEIKGFQELSNRARKDVKLDEIKVAVCVFAFDLMYLNGESLLECTFRERRQLLRTRFFPRHSRQKTIAGFNFVESCESEGGNMSIEEFWIKATESRCEGLMFKLLDSGITLETDPTNTTKPRKKPLLATYEPDKRTTAWLKLKKDYILGVGDSLDLIPIGAWHGNGRKAQWWSPILMGLWNNDTGRIVAVCKCMSGFTDAFYKALGERYDLTSQSQTCSRQPRWEVDTGGFSPEVYFKPQEVWEIRGADITESPVSTAAKGLASSERGLSIRFPRFIKRRDDKSVEQASTPEFLVGIWRSQQNAGRGGNDAGELVDAEMEMSDVSLEESSEEEEDEDAK